MDAEGHLRVCVTDLSHDMGGIIAGCEHQRDERPAERVGRKPIRWRTQAHLIHGRLELTKFHAPSGRGGDRHTPANTPGIRHLTFAVDDIDAAVASVRARGGELVGEVENYQDIYRLCYVRGPEGIIVELAEQIG